MNKISIWSKEMLEKPRKDTKIYNYDKNKKIRNFAHKTVTR